MYKHKVLGVAFIFLAAWFLSNPVAALAQENHAKLIIDTLTKWDKDMSKLAPLLSAYGLPEEIVTTRKYSWIKANLESYFEGCRAAVQDKFYGKGWSCGMLKGSLKHYLSNEERTNMERLLADVTAAVDKVVTVRREAQKTKEQEMNRQREVEQQRIAAEKKAVEAKREAEQRKKEEAERQAELEQKRKYLAIATKLGFKGYYKGLIEITQGVMDGTMTLEEAKKWMVLTRRTDIILKVQNLIDNYVVYRSTPYGTYQIVMVKEPGRVYMPETAMEENCLLKITGTSKFQTALGQTIELLVVEKIRQ